MEEGEIKWVWAAWSDSLTATTATQSLTPWCQFGETKQPLNYRLHFHKIEEEKTFPKWLLNASITLLLTAYKGSIKKVTKECIYTLDTKISKISENPIQLHIYIIIKHGPITFIPDIQDFIQINSSIYIF